MLASRGPLDTAIQYSGIKGLDVVPCGQVPPNPSEILNSRAFGRLLKDLSARYDHVLIDAPPVLPVADARILGARCDAALLVVHAEKSSRKPSQQAAESLLSVGTRLLGIVVNGVKLRGRGYGYGYGYGSGYGSYRQELEDKVNDAEYESETSEGVVA